MDLLDGFISNFPLYALIILVSAAAAFFVGQIAVRHIKGAALRIVLLIGAESVLILTMVPFLVRWVKIGSFSWGFWYEGGWYLFPTLSVMIGVLIGYLLGTAVVKRKA